MDNMEYTSPTSDIIAGLTVIAVKEKIVNLYNIRGELRNILNKHKLNKTAEDFIKAVMNNDANNIFYNYLLEVLIPLGGDKSIENICNRLIFDIREYIREGLTGRLQLHLEVHNAIKAEESITNAPHLRYPLMLTKLYRQTSPNRIDNFPPRYKSPKSMRVINTIPASTAVICSDRYCNGDRDPRIVSVVMELTTILVNYSKLYFNNVISKYNETNSVAASIIHGIDSILPEGISACELNPDFWDYPILGTILDLQARFDISGPPHSLSILDELKSELKGTSSFDVRDLISMTLGYNDLESLDVIMRARLILKSNNIDYYF